MPIVFYDKKPGNVQFAIWKIDETESSLESILNPDSEDKQTYKSFSLEIRRKQWLVARILVNKLINKNSKIFYNENGKPFLENESSHISVSHTQNYVAVITSDTSEVGIDIEHLSDRIYKIKHRFMNDDEALKLPTSNELLYLYLLWSAKEAVYKIYNDTHLYFKDIQVLNVDFLTCKMDVLVNNGKYSDDFVMNYRIFDNNILVWTKKV